MVPQLTLTASGRNSLIGDWFACIRLPETSFYRKFWKICRSNYLAAHTGKHQMLHVLFAHGFHLLNWERVTGLKLLLVRLRTTHAGIHPHSLQTDRQLL